MHILQIMHLFVIAIAASLFRHTTGEHLKTIEVEYADGSIKTLVLKYSMTSSEVMFEFDAETLGTFAVGFSHNKTHDEVQNINFYDSFVGGIKDGKPYGGSYELLEDRYREYENKMRYEVHHADNYDYS